MKYLLFVFFFATLGLASFGQEPPEIATSSKVVDSLYREDQFYISLTIDLLSNTPDDIKQSGFSGGFHLGFIRDMPINRRRNVALGLGVGYSYNSFGQNLRIDADPMTNKTLFSSLGNQEVNTNRFTTQMVEVPIEFRWRTSVPETHKFYRVYAGLRMGYVYRFRSNFNQNGVSSRQKDIPEINALRYGATFTFGWNTYNFSVYYSLNPLFGDDATINDQKVGINPIKIGFTFYIL